MNSERQILKRLLEGVEPEYNPDKPEEDLDEASFESGGKRYSSAFGHYTCDGEPISREDYFKAKQSGSTGSGGPSSGTGSPKKSNTMNINKFTGKSKGDYYPETGTFYGNVTKDKDTVDAPVNALKSGNLSGLTYGKSYKKSFGSKGVNDLHTFTDENGNEGVIEVETRGGSPYSGKPTTYAWYMFTGDEAKKRLSDEGYKEVSDSHEG